MSIENLEKFAKNAEAAGYRAWVISSEAVKKVPEFCCLIYVDERDRHYVVQGLFANQLSEFMLEQEGFSRPPRSETDIVMLQLTVFLPFAVEESAFAETAQLLHIMNISIPVGQFILSQSERLVVFRAVLPHSDYDLAPWLVVEAIHMARYFILQFTPLIESVAEGTLTHLQVIAALREYMPS